MADAKAGVSGGMGAQPAALPWWDPGRQPHLSEEIEAQVRLALMIRAAGFDPADPEVHQVVTWLENLCAGTLTNMRREGRLFRKCASLNMRSLPTAPDSWPLDSGEVIAETSIAAAREFVTEKIMTWLPERASMPTFFVNCSLFTFERIYRAYRRQKDLDEGQVLRDGVDVVNLFDERSQLSASDGQTVDRLVILEILRLQGDSRIAEIVAGLAQGKTKVQIAKELGIAPATLYRAIADFRNKLRTAGFSDEGGMI